MLSKVKNNYSKIILVIGIAAALLIRYICLDFESFDYLSFLRKWVQHFADNGGWRAIKDQVGDYNVMYQYIVIICSYLNISSLYAIKLFSIVFDFVLALGCCKLIGCFGVSRAKQHVIFVIILLLPTVWLNSAVWGQCDSIYVSFIIWSLYFFFKEKKYLSLAFLSLAFTFKLQTVFVMPVFFILFVKERIKIRHLAMFPITYFITCIPALLLQKPFSDILGIYFKQTSEYPMLSMNAPTFWQMIDVVQPDEMLKRIGMILAALVVVAFIIAVLIKKDKLDNKAILTLALIFGVGIPFFLPHMHDRYFFMADIISVVYVFVFGFKRVHVPIFVQTASAICYLYYLGLTNLIFGNILPAFMNGMISGTLMFAAFVQILLYWRKDFNNKSLSVLYNYCAIGAVAVVFAVIQFCLPSQITVKANDKTVCYMGVYPYQQEETVMVPIKGFLNAAGYFVTADHDTGHILAKKDGECIEFDFAAEEAILPDGSKMKFRYPRDNINSNNLMASYDLCLITGMSEEFDGKVLHFVSK